jgi:hypothetical protein
MRSAIKQTHALVKTPLFQFVNRVISCKNLFLPFIFLPVIAFGRFAEDCVSGLTLTPATQTICQDGTPTDLTATITITTGTGVSNITYEWYSNSTSSTIGGTLVKTTNNKTTATTTDQFTPPASSSGTLYYYVVVTNSDGTCPTLSHTSGAVEVIVNPTLVPSVDIESDDADNSICAGSPITFTATPTNGGSSPLYQWRVNGLNVGSNSSINTFTPSTTLTDGSVVTVVLTSNATPCLTGSPVESDDIIVTVNELPAVNAGAAVSAICQGGTSVALGGSFGGGATSAVWSDGSAGGTFANNTGTTPGTTTYTASSTGSSPVILTLTTAGGSCGSVFENKQIIINPLPTIDIGSAIPAVCQGTPTVALGGSFGGGATSAVWSDGGAGGSFTNNSGATPGTTVYTPSITATSPITLTLTSGGGGCGVATDTKSLIVNPVPTVNAGGAIAAICQSGTTLVLSGSFGGSATSAVWSDGGAGGTFINNGGSTPGTATYTASATATSPITLTLTTSGGLCGDVSAQKSLTINQLPTVNAGAAIADICQGATSVNLGGSFGGGATGAVWSDGGAGGSFTNNTGSTPGTAKYIAAANSPSPVTLTITSTGGNCGQVTDSKTIVVNQNPTVNSGAALTAICQGGTTIALGGSFGGGATGAVWSSNVVGGSFANNGGSTPNIATYTASATSTSPVTLTLTSTGGSCGVVTASKTLTVNPLLTPSVSINSSSTSICTTAPAGSTPVTFSVASTTNPGAGPNYQWKLNGANIGGATSSSYVASSLANGSQITVAMTSNATCASPATATSNAITMTGFTPPAQPTFVASAGNVNIASGICPPANGLVYTVNSSSNESAFNWTVPSGWTIVSGQGTNSIIVNVTISAIEGNQNVSVSASNACGTSSNRQFAVNVNKSAGVNAGPDTAVCANGSITLTGTATGYANKVAWTNPSNDCLSTSNSFTYTPTITSGNITLTFSSTQQPGNVSCRLFLTRWCLL